MHDKAEHSTELSAKLSQNKTKITGDISNIHVLHTRSSGLSTELPMKTFNQTKLSQHSVKHSPVISCMFKMNFELNFQMNLHVKLSTKLSLINFHL